jgi:hypothetical protein
MGCRCSRTSRSRSLKPSRPRLNPKQNRPHRLRLKPVARRR